MPELQVETLGALIDAQVVSRPEAMACSVRQGDVWVPLSWAQVGRRLAAARTQLARLGLGPGAVMAIIAPNQLDWDVAHWAALQLGASVVGIDAFDRPENVNEVIRTTRPTLVVLNEVAALGPLGGMAKEVGLITLAEATPSRADGGVAEPLWRELGEAPATGLHPVQPGDLSTTIFTSGTTGQPKGIAYTHRQVYLAARSVSEALPQFQVGNRVPCWLPQAHLFQRVINFSTILRGGHLFYVEKPLELARLLPSMAPHVMVAVPRFFEKAWAGILETISRKPAPVRAVARWALAVGQKAAAERRAGRPLGAWRRWQHQLADRWVLAPIRSAFGGHVRYMISGAAPLPLWLLEAFHGVGILVLEAYGLSENVVPNCMNTPSAFRFGTVGRPTVSTQVRLTPEGEIQVKGEGVFSGYVGSTASVLDAEGWLSTGDLGAIDADGYVSIFGRKSEVVKTSTGRKVSLPAVEAVLRQLSWVELPVVVALGRVAPLALLYVNVARLGAPAAEATLRLSLEFIRREIQAVCAQLPDFQRPAGVCLIASTPSLQKGELTASMKVRRTQVEARYGAALEVLTQLVAQKKETAQWLDQLDVLVTTT